MPNEKERYEPADDVLVQRPRRENGVRGARIYGPNGNSIFLPVCGFGLWYGEEDPFNSTDGAYWTGVEEPEYGFNGRPIEPSNVAKSMGVDSSGFTGASSRKAYGLNIRAVINPQESGIGGVTPGLRGGVIDIPRRAHTCGRRRPRRNAEGVRPVREAHILRSHNGWSIPAGGYFTRNIHHLVH